MSNRAFVSDAAGVTRPASGSAWCAVCVRMVLAVLGVGCVAGAPAATNWVVVGWNNLGMHCMDSDYSVFSILPPYNTINAQVIRTIGSTTVLITNPAAANVSVAYTAVADAAGSINTTSQGKSDFWQYAQALFGISLPMDVGLPVPGPQSYAMPTNGTLQALGFESNMNWFVAYGIPITPYDDNANGKPNPYPMMRLVARNPAGAPLAETRIVLPVSDEMDCKLCHLSGSGAAARPGGGWVNDPNPGRDYRLNILRLHDEEQAADPAYAAALASIGFNPAGLYATAMVDRRPILCAACHLSEALPGSGLAGIKALTAAMHGFHAEVRDPRNNLTLDAETNRVSCYTCHPGSVTRCLRGAMGKAVAGDGSMAMQCQSCHGSMAVVGSTNRTGWLDEPNCQACHTGDAVANSGSIRYTSVYTNGAMRVPANARFATTPDAPLAGKSLYRFSRGHGGVMCSGCHGSTHAEFPSSTANDNAANEQHQGHAGVLSECAACHVTPPASAGGGPHGMHFPGQGWVKTETGGVESKPHVDAFRGSSGGVQCRACHGNDYRGTVLSAAQDNRLIDAGDFGLRLFWRGQRVGCYDCHNGVIDHGNPGPAAPVTHNVAGTTDAGVPLALALPGSGATSWRIVSQPGNGTVGVSGSTATYYPGVSFSGTDTFTFAAAGGFRESNLATGTVAVTARSTPGDGIPDWWRQQHFGCVSCTNAAATADPDYDGFLNAEEYGAGTDPLDARSALRIHAVGTTTTGASVGFDSLLGWRYQLEWASSLPAAGWTNVGGSVWGHTDTVAVSDPAAADQPQRFYRVRVQP